VACHLLKWVHFRQDVEGLDLELRHFRDTDGREVDFVVTRRNEPVLLVECRLSETRLDRNLRCPRASQRRAPPVEFGRRRWA